MTWQVIHGDMLDVLRGLDDNSIDSCVTDPPYGIGFMAKSWDHGVPGKEYWEQVLRVLRPGGHLLAFGGSRMYHRMFCAIEDAGFEIRDTLMWVYGSGFPKSLDVSKALDKAAGAEREVVGTKLGQPGYSMSPTAAQRSAQWGLSNPEAECAVTAPATDLARQWNGWGTALKPAHEPICMARKPLEGPVAFNVAKWGVGGLNIDRCRVGTENTRRSNVESIGYGGSNRPFESGSDSGRWPANLLHDGSDEVVGLFPAQGAGSAARFFYHPKANRNDRNEGCDGLPLGDPPANGRSKPSEGRQTVRGAPVKNSHPTVKPTELMRYLTRLVTPPGGLVLDPFVGSGSTGKAAVLEGFSFVGVEREAEYVAIAEARIAAAAETK